MPCGQIRLEQHSPVPVLGKGRGAVVDSLALAKQWRGCVWSWPDVVSVSELVSARPHQGAASTWAFARAAGALDGVLAGLGVVRQHRVPASVWKPAFGLPGGRKGKQEAVALAQRLTGVAGLTEHVAEAALIAWWWAKMGDGGKHAGT
jgi:hypothetical protein